MIRLENITKRYDEKLVLNDISIDFKENTINIVSGPSGCGKTTLFNIICALDSNYEGNVYGIPDKVGYLFQEDRLLPYYSVLENILFTLPDDIDNEIRNEIAVNCLSRMDLLSEKDAFPHELSGGMARRAAIARALAYPSELLLLDEPFNGLNIELKRTVIDAILLNMLDKPKTIITITHDLSPFNQNDLINKIDLSKLLKLS